MFGGVAETGTKLNECLALGATESPNDELLANEARIKEDAVAKKKQQHNERMRKRYTANRGFREKAKAKTRKWYAANPEHYAKIRETVSYTHLTLPTICSV